MIRLDRISAVIGLTLLCLVSLALSPPARAGLDILLTNDDGIDARGLVVLREALVTAGHRVRVIAPSGNRSGSGASLTIGPVVVEERDIGLAVDATPASAILVAAGLDPPPRPDLVVSGTNHGANVGYVTPVSGTVGAALVAASPLGLAVPAIAISTDLPGRNPATDASAAQLRRAARFAVELIASLEAAASSGSALLPPGVALNANVPLTENHRGVRFCRQGQTGTIEIGYRKREDGRFLPEIRHGDEEVQDAPGSDTAAFKAGYTTVVPLIADYTAPEAVWGALRERLGRSFELGVD